MGNVLILGGSGFVGSALRPKLAEAGHTITVLNRGTKTLEGVVQLKADRNSKEALAAALNQMPKEIGFDVIIDTAAYTLRQTRNVFELLGHKTKHWIHLSSAAVYKEADVHPKEDFPIGGAKVWGDYGADKSAIDHFLLHEQHDVPVTILRPPYLYGPNNDNLRERFVWNRAIHKVPLFVPGDGTTHIQFLHVDDLADALVLCAGTPVQESMAYNIAAEEKVSLSNWVATVLNAGTMTTEVVNVGSAAADFTPRHYFPFRDYSCCVATGLFDQKMHWKPKYNSISTGLHQTFASYRLEALSERIPITEAEVALSKRLRGQQREA